MRQIIFAHAEKIRRRRHAADFVQEFFNGFRWSDDLDELKFIIQRDKKDLSQHLLETEEFREKFYGGDLEKMTDASEFRVKVK